MSLKRTLKKNVSYTTSPTQFSGGKKLQLDYFP